MRQTPSPAALPGKVLLSSQTSLVQPWREFHALRCSSARAGRSNFRSAQGRQFATEALGSYRSQKTKICGMPPGDACARKIGWNGHAG